ncbi:MAG TPA: GAF domain-containing protein [Ohtaekwangia sp.]|uniref:GAF domain-containing protein n=1 Tax=Ohtaekwangia sp. TaxID=2066019 RepID=UPI002F95689E
MKLTIRQQILLLIGVNSALIICVLYISYSGIRNLNDAKDTLAQEGKQLNYLLLAQNMRDNLRGLVYRGFSVDHSDVNEKMEIRKEFDEQIKGFIDNTQKLLKLNGKDPVVDEIYTKGKEYAAFSTDLFVHEIDGDAESFLMLSEFGKYYTGLVKPMNAFNNKIQHHYASLEEQGNVTARKSLSGIFSIALFAVSGSLIISVIISNRIVKRIKRASRIITDVSQGKLPERSKDASSDEVGVMMQSLNSYLDSVTETVKFAVEVGKGNLDVVYTPLSEHDQLGKSLLEMRGNLKKAAVEDEKRNWVLNGMAGYVDLSRKESHNIATFADHVLSYLVRYMQVNQAFFYTVEEKAEGEEVLLLKAGYAWDRKKYYEQEIEKGNGLAGQAWQEGSMIYLRDIPADYVKITSGLGMSTPRNLVILPLKVNDIVYGVIEIASFKEIEQHELGFLEKIAENIASTLANVLTAERTQNLLYQSQEQMERLNAQEEEMRQNMEEMQATQEELARKEREYMAQIRRLNDELRSNNESLEKKEAESNEHALKDMVAEALRKQGEISQNVYVDKTFL